MAPNYTSSSSPTISMIGQQKVVKTTPGRGTGDIVYITEDGRRWIPYDYRGTTCNDVQEGK